MMMVMLMMMTVFRGATEHAVVCFYPKTKSMHKLDLKKYRRGSAQRE
jgi:hypothetical protein